MLGHDQPYTIQSGTVVVGKLTLPNRRTSSTEFNRTAVMMGLLLKKYGSLLDIESSQDNSRFCPFTGGGDIHLQRKNAIDSSSNELHEIAIEKEHTNFLVGDADDIADFVFGIEASDRLSQHIDSTFQLDSDSESYLSDSEGNYSDSDSEEAMTDD